MARRKVSPEAQIIALFTGLSEEGKKMVMFGLNAIMSNEAPKSNGICAPTAGKKSSRKGAATNSTASTGTNTDSALDVVHGAIGEL